MSDHPDECDCAECLRAESYRLGEAYRQRLERTKPPALDPRKVLLAQMAASIAAGLLVADLADDVDAVKASVRIARAILDEVGLPHE